MKTILPQILMLVIMLSLISTLCSSQSTGVIGLKETSGYSQGYNQSIKTSDGGILAVGVIGPYGRITKFNSSYVELWSFGVDSIPITDVIETNDGNYVILGYSNKTNFNGAPFILKMNSAGTVIFKKIYYTSIVSNPFTASGICKAAGTDNGFVFYGGNCFAMDYIAKCDANGNIQWENTYVGTGNGYFAAMISETNGYVADFNCTQLGVQSVGIMKFDVSGNVLWCNVMQSTNNVAPLKNSLVKKNSGNYFLMTSPGDVFGAQTYAINSTGTTTTCMRYINAVQIEMTSALATGNTNDEILITGGLSPGYGTYIKLNASGNIVYQKQSNTFTSYFYHATSLNNGSYLMAGSTSSYGKILAVIDESGAGVCTTANLSLASSSLTFNLTSPAITPYAIAVLDTDVNYSLYSFAQTRTILCGSLNSDELSDDTRALKIFPNPTTGKLNVKSENISSIVVFNALGENVYSFSATDQRNYSQAIQSLMIDLSGQADGIYFLKVETEKGFYSDKVILQK